MFQINKFGFLLILFIAPIFLYAQSVQFEWLGENKTYMPGEVYNLVVKATNTSNNSVVLKPKLSLPINWQFIAAPETLILNASQSKIHISTFSIPLYANKGIHTIQLEAIDLNGVALPSKAFDIHVGSIQKISIQQVSANNYIKAGTTIESVFSVKNEGNNLEQVNLQTTLGAIILGHNPIEITPGDSKIVTVQFPTNKSNTNAHQQLIMLAAKPSVEPAVEVLSYSAFTIRPLRELKIDQWNRMPIKASVNFVQSQYNNIKTNGFQGEISGSVGLNEFGKNHITFRAISPNPNKVWLSTLYEEYYATYQSENTYVHIGDKSFNASYLTEFSRYGRGVEVQQKINKFEIGGFFNKPRFFNDIKNQFNIYTQFNPNQQAKIKYGYLHKLTNNNENINIQYLTANAQFFKRVNVETEYAFSKGKSLKNEPALNGDAKRIQVNTRLNKTAINASFVHASTNFAGYFNNTHFFTTNISQQISKRINMGLTYQKDARNIKQDTLFGTAPFREFSQFTLDYRYAENGNISANVGLQEYEDRMENKQFFYKDNFFRINLNQKKGSFALNLQAYIAETANFLMNTKGDSKQLTSGITYSKKNTFLNIYGTYSILSRYQTANEQSILYGAQFNTVLFDKLKVNFFYQNTYHLEDYFKERDLLELALSYNLSPDHQFELQSRQTIPQKQVVSNDFSFAIKYTVNFRVPISKRKQIGALHGNITNYGATVLSGLKLHLGPYTTTVDENGNYQFNNIKSGSYYLEVNPETISFNDITSIKSPTYIEIKDGSNFLNFEINPAVKIKGAFSGFNQETSNKEEAQTLADFNVIVEIKSDTEVFRKICNVLQPFEFSGLRPGTWTLKVYENSSNPNYKINAQEQVYNLNSGETAIHNMEVQKKHKEIKYLQQPIKVGFTSTKSK